MSFLNTHKKKLFILWNDNNLAKATLNDLLYLESQSWQEEV